ncbi:hypothetical protein RhiJN_01502 [Ceratobasidium sp. AG-Ba]|nr:hypothetical protein RhiJN_01502 [Ceratobasidium sp. AG-Ba]QRW02483.1 hypothetical protein RhiLY_01481 [Ceratobasidium sp. AG-Ba]
MSTSNTNYNSSDLSGCKLDTVSLSASYANYVADFEASIICALTDDIEISVMTGNTVRLSSPSTNNSYATPLAMNIRKLMDAFNRDFFDDVLFGGYGSSPGNPDKSFTAIYINFAIGADSTITWSDGSYSAQGLLITSTHRSEVPEYFSPSSTEAFENLIHIFSGSILTDLGVKSRQNPLTSTTAFTSAVKPLNWTWRASQTPNVSQASQILSTDMPQYNIPFDSLEPTHFNALYLCHYFYWKSLGVLIVDVFVATVSMFTVFWHILNFILKFWAVSGQPGGKLVPIDPTLD